MSEHSKRQLQNLFDQLEECCTFLQDGFGDYVNQVKRRITEGLECNLTFKEAIIMVTTAHSVLLEHTDMLTESTKLYPLTVMTKAKSTPEGQNVTSADDQLFAKSSKPEILRRLENIEMTLSSLQNTQANNEEIKLGIKQERNISVSEQSDVDFKIDKMSTEQNHEFQNLRKDLNEQEIKMKELSKLIESLDERESKSNKTIEKLNLYIEENEKSLFKLNENIQALTERLDRITQKLTRHSDLIYDLQEADKKTILTTKNKIDNILSKQAVVCKVLQQRLSPLDKLLQMLNQNSKSREENLKKIEALEDDIFRLSRDIHKIATNQQASHSTVGFIASGSQLDKRRAVQGLYTLSYTTVEHSIGHHFNPTSGGFTAPVDGLYVASLIIKQTGHETVQGWLMHKSGKTASWFGPVETKGDIYVFSNTFVIRMKTGDVLFSQSDSLGIQCRQFSCFLLGN